MTDHLPECIFSYEEINSPCICDRLRSCRERTLTEARDAVDARRTHAEPCGCGACYIVTDALAAIDALRGGS